MSTIIGIDIGGMSVKAAAVTDGKIVTARRVIPTPAPQVFAEKISELALGVIAEAKEQNLNACAIGIGCPGIVSREGVVLFSNNLGLNDYPLKQLVGSAVGLPVTVLNDAFCATLAEFAYGAGRGAEIMAMLTIGTGVGCGIVVNGKLLMGKNACTAGGHIVVRGGDNPCNCGGNGCLETQASMSAVLKFAEHYAKEEGEESLFPKGFSGLHVFETANRGSVAAKRALKVFYEGLGDGIVSLCNLLRPDKIVIGGGVSARGAALTDILEKYVEERIYIKRRFADFSIVCAQTGNDAGIIGAAEYAKKS